MLKDKGQLSFEDKWPSMRPTILKLLRQETVTREQWQDLFWLVHSVCLWDEKGPPKVYAALRDDILEFIKQAQERVLSHLEDQALLKAYIAEWRKFFTQCSYLPMPFGQLETSLQVSYLGISVPSDIIFVYYRAKPVRSRRLSRQNKKVLFAN